MGTNSPSTNGNLTHTGINRVCYNQKALAEIRNSLKPFAANQIICTSGVSSNVENIFKENKHHCGIFSTDNSNYNDSVLDWLGNSESDLNQFELLNGFSKISGVSIKPMTNYERTSPAFDSNAPSNSPNTLGNLSQHISHPSPEMLNPLSYHSCQNEIKTVVPPLPSRSQSHNAIALSSSLNTAPSSPVQGIAQSNSPYAYMTNSGNISSTMQHLFKRISPVHNLSSRNNQSSGGSISQNNTPQYGTSPVSQLGRHQLILQNNARTQQQLTQQFQNGKSQDPPPPYPLLSSSHAIVAGNKISIPPPSYHASMQARQSPTLPENRKMPCLMSSPSQGPCPSSLHPLTPHQAKTQFPVIMHSVKSTQVQKPVLQTAVAPTSPPPYSSANSSTNNQNTKLYYVGGGTIPITEPPSYSSTVLALSTQKNSSTLSSASLVHQTQAPVRSIISSVLDSSASDNPDVSQNGKESDTSSDVIEQCGSDFSNEEQLENNCRVLNDNSSTTSYSTGSSFSSHSPISFLSSQETVQDETPYRMHSPIPERRECSHAKEERRVRSFSSQAYKFYMEQHYENLLKHRQERIHRSVQLENEMSKVGLSIQAQQEMRKLLCQKESNYIRMKRAKMDISMFRCIKTIGIGAFGEVALARKIDTNALYAMKILNKKDVYKRNQVAHVKAERDILAEADNEWVVKLYYSFQDKEKLYFVMDYIPGGDLMSLLSNLGIFDEPLARFYIAELVCAIESVHRMGFIHRDIKPDNILIDRDGHIKLTDFGLCTGFRWTHDSKYYQDNDHCRQDSLIACSNWTNECRCEITEGFSKPLERRRRRAHQRCLAHSLVGTPNYIAPEVLKRPHGSGYTQLCDWWSLGVILYEMVVGRPPFLANTPAETQFKVINWESTLHIPSNTNLSREATDLILNLCTNAERRLGLHGALEVKAHPFFKTVDFENIRHLPTLYVPNIQHPTDTSNFEPIGTERLPNSNGECSDDDNTCNQGNECHPEHAFFEFTFRRFFDNGGHAYPLREDTGYNNSPVYV